MPNMKTKFDREILDAMSKNPNNWKGVFYFNHRDPRLVVPKRYPSLGWTLNFASTNAYLLMIAIVLIIIVTTYFR